MTGRRDEVLDSALATFSRLGFRKTSMDAVAAAAAISRPGLYFLFESKDDLFRAAVTRALERDLAAVETALARRGAPLQRRLLDAFDQWAGVYVGPLARDIDSVIAERPDLVGPIGESAPRRFRQLLLAALREAAVADATLLADTLLTLSVGAKHRSRDRAEYRRTVRGALTLLLPAAP